MCNYLCNWLIIRLFSEEIRSQHKVTALGYEQQMSIVRREEILKKLLN